MNEVTCSCCKNEITDDSDFCPRCGSLFAENIKCILHDDVNAEGVCLICSEPYCSDCGDYLKKVFLCKEHISYEIYEGFARIFGSSDTLQCEFVKSCLEQNSLHPFIFSTQSSQIFVGNTEFNLSYVWGDMHRKNFNEIKLLVPCSEVLDAEKILEELKI